MAEAYEVEKKLLDALKRNPHRYLDERELTEKFGLAAVMGQEAESTGDLERTVELLRMQGYQIDGDATGGWMLIGLPEAISRFELEEELQTTFLGRCMFTYRIIGSTNETARSLAAGGVPDGTLLVAEEQIGGRGRRGNDWFSPAGGGIWASLVLRPGISARQLGSVGMLASLSICLGIEQHTGLKPMIKWPNDLYLDGRKLGGVLCEADWRAGQLQYLVLGFGLNVNVEEFPGRLAESSISLSRVIGRTIHRTALLAEILLKLEEGYFQLLTDGFASFLPRVQVRDYLKSRQVLVEFENGEKLAGVASGIDEYGALLVQERDCSRMRSITSGHLVQF
jgi:BirA family transcriptional regulator, biotin operon repressor / biotin---[acetyl-CoA-carboxylase] ligase